MLCDIGANTLLPGIEGLWPALLGLNAVEPAPGAELLATGGGYPLLLAGQYRRGRSVAFTSDCAPHWAPPAFVGWKHYPRLWNQIVVWAAGGARRDHA